MYKISKEFSFCASHLLMGLPADHPCSRVHGHNYVVTVELESIKVDNLGFVLDYRKFSHVKEFIDNKLDHQHLNDVVEFNPTAENLAKYIFLIFHKMYPQLSAVTVKETEKTSATYYPQHDETPDKV